MAQLNTVFLVGRKLGQERPIYYTDWRVFPPDRTPPYLQLPDCFFACSEPRTRLQSLSAAEVADSTAPDVDIEIDVEADANPTTP
jgi:hypothetical protein